MNINSRVKQLQCRLFSFDLGPNFPLSRIEVIIGSGGAKGLGIMFPNPFASVNSGSSEI